MGTLHSQAERQRLDISKQDIIDYIDELKAIAEKTKLSIDQVIKVAEIKQLERQNSLFVNNGDAHDEQMSGIGECIDKISSSIERLAEAVEFQNENQKL